MLCLTTLPIPYIEILRVLQNEFEPKAPSVWIACKVVLPRSAFMITLYQIKSLNVVNMTAVQTLFKLVVTEESHCFHCDARNLFVLSPSFPRPGLLYSHYFFSASLSYGALLSIYVSWICSAVDRIKWWHGQIGNPSTTRNHLSTGQGKTAAVESVHPLFTYVAVLAMLCSY